MPKNEKKINKRISSLLSVLLVLIIAVVAMHFGIIGTEETAYDSTTQTTQTTTTVSAEDGRIRATFVRIVDGDTLILNYNGQDNKVRLIGVNTPESVHRDKSKNTPEGKTASKYTNSIMENATDIYIAYDKAPQDRYGRELCFVYVTVDGKTEMLQEMLLKKGYANTMSIKPNITKAKHFEELRDEAKENGVGFWGDEERVKEIGW